MATKYRQYTPRADLKSVILTFLFFLFSLICMSSYAQWQSFKWIEYELNAVLIKKAAILLPVRLDGIHCDMQLDTGVGIGILYRHALPSRYSHLLKSETLLIERFALASEAAPKTFELMYTKKKKPSKKCGVTNDSNLVGTLANDSFADGSLSLDLARAQFKFEKGPYRHFQDKKYEIVDLEILKSKNNGSFPVVALTLDNGEQKKVLFDTGSAAASLMIFLKSDWLKLVGLEKIDKVKPVFTPRWGQMIPCYFAPLNQSVSIGNIRFGSATIAGYCEDTRDDPGIINPFFGLVGLAPFSENVITLDYVSKKLLIETVESVMLDVEAQ